MSIDERIRDISFSNGVSLKEMSEELDMNILITSGKVMLIEHYQIHLQRGQSGDTFIKL